MDEDRQCLRVFPDQSKAIGYACFKIFNFFSIILHCVNRPVLSDAISELTVLEYNLSVPIYNALSKPPRRAPSLPLSHTLIHELCCDLVDCVGMKKQSGRCHIALCAIKPVQRKQCEDQGQ